MLTSPLHCTECGKPIRGSAGLGRCGACALRGAITLEGKHGDDTSPNDSGNPKRLGDYDLIEELARGGMGVVYRARQRSLGREVALKVLLGGAFAGEDGKRRLRTEAAAAGRLQHPNIVAIHDAGVVDGQPFFSMTLVEGPTLAQLAAAGTLTPAQAARYVARIAEAVHYAHSQGVLHRDLKPSNVLIDANDEPRVTDFGLAKGLASDAHSALLHSHITLTGQVLGSPAYMAPEQAVGHDRELGPASDVYSLGAILYDLLTGRPPFLGETPHSVIEQVRTLDPIPVRRLNPGIPVALETVCLKCLEKEPRRRYATARELAEELTRYLNGETVHAQAVGPAGRLYRIARRRPWHATAVLLAMALLISTGVALAWKARTEQLHAMALLKEQASTRLAIIRSQLSEARALIQNRQADSRPRAESILAKVLKDKPPAELRAQARDLALAALALPSARTEPLLGEGVKSDDWTFGAGDMSRERWALATFRGKIVLRSVHAETNLLEFNTAPRVVTTLIAFSPGGRWLAVRHRDELGIWDTSDGTTQRLAFVTKAWGKENPFGFGKTAFTPDDRALLWLDGSAVVATALPYGRELARWHDTNSIARNVEALTVAQDGQSFAVARTQSSVIEVHSWAEGRMKRKLIKRPSQEITALAVTSEAGGIAAGDTQGRVMIFAGDGSGDPKFEFTSHSEAIRAMNFAEDGRHLATISEDETLRLWDCVTGTEVATLPYEGTAISVSADGQILGVGLAGGNFSTVRFERSPILQRFRPGPVPKAPQMLSFHPDGRSLFCLVDGGVARCSVPDGSLLAFYPSTGARNVFAEPGNHGGLIISGIEGLKRYSLAVPLIETTLVPNKGIRWGGTSASADGRWLAACSIEHSGEFAIWPAGDRNADRMRIVTSGLGGLGETAISPDGSKVAATHFVTEDVIVFDVAKGSVIKRLPLPARHAIAWSPDGRWLAGAGSTFRLWDAATWEPANLPSLQPNFARFTAAAFSELGADQRSRHLAVTTGSNRTAILAMATGVIVAELEAPQARPICKLNFSRDGRWLAAAVLSGEIQLWDLPAIFAQLQKRGFDTGLE